MIVSDFLGFKDNQSLVFFLFVKFPNPQWSS